MKCWWLGFFACGALQIGVGPVDVEAPLWGDGVLIECKGNPVVCRT